VILRFKKICSQTWCTENEGRMTITTCKLTLTSQWTTVHRTGQKIIGLDSSAADEACSNCQQLHSLHRHQSIRILSFWSRSDVHFGYSFTNDIPFLITILIHVVMYRFNTFIKQEIELRIIITIINFLSLLISILFSCNIPNHHICHIP